MTATAPQIQFIRFPKRLTYCDEIECFSWLHITELLGVFEFEDEDAFAKCLESFSLS